MKILQLAPQFPFPEENGGKIGIASTFRQLSKNAQITFFCFNDGKVKEEYLREAEKYGKIIIYQHSVKNSLVRIFKSLFYNEPLYLRKHFDNHILEILDELVSENDFDIIHSDHTAMAPLALKIRSKFNIPVGLRLHNVEHLIWERYYNALSIFKPQKYYIYSQFTKLRNAESKILNLVDVAFPITSNDAELAKKISPESNVIVAGPGINLDNWIPLEKPRNRLQLIHATTYDWIHNVDAIRWFIREVMPILRAKYPGIKLTLLGKNPPNDFFDNIDIGVETLGFVDNIKELLSSAGIYIAPLFVGGGIRIKILEAMAMKLPVVASPIAAEGISTSENNGLFIANSSDEFIQKISSLINNQNYINEYGNNARNFILNNYTWEKSIGIIFETYKKIIDK